MNNFKKYRELQGLTQKEVAILLKVSVQAVSYWENGTRMPSYENLVQMADIYHVTTDELLGRTDPPPEKQEKPAGKTDRLDEALVNLLSDLPQKDIQRVRDFVAGLKAGKED